MKVLVVPMEENQTAYTTDGVLDLASKYGEATERFEQFCRENLCLESWFFTVDTVLYQRVSWYIYYAHKTETTKFVAVGARVWYSGRPHVSYTWYMCTRMLINEQIVLFHLGTHKRPGRAVRRVPLHLGPVLARHISA